MADVHEKVRAELAQLKRNRQSIDAQIVELEAFLRVHDRFLAPENGSVKTRARSGKSISIGKTLSQKAQVISGAEQFLAKVSGMQTRDLLAALESHGVKIGGKDKILRVSGILSREKDKFRSDKELGWTLRRPAQKVEGDSASTGSPSNVRH